MIRIEDALKEERGEKKPDNELENLLAETEERSKLLPHPGTEGPGWIRERVRMTPQKFSVSRIFCTCETFMVRDSDLLLSNPPKHRYMCVSCGRIEYLSREGSLPSFP